ncbi:MAG: hypothetical protein AAF599_17505 [Bacteroidota bacterium]
MNEAGSGSSYGFCFERVVRLGCPMDGQTGAKNAFFVADMIL